MLYIAEEDLILTVCYVIDFTNYWPAFVIVQQPLYLNTEGPELSSNCSDVLEQG